MGRIRFNWGAHHAQITLLDVIDGLVSSKQVADDLNRRFKRARKLTERDVERAARRHRKALLKVASTLRKERLSQKDSLIRYIAELLGKKYVEKLERLDRERDQIAQEILDKAATVSLPVIDSKRHERDTPSYKSHR